MLTRILLMLALLFGSIAILCFSAKPVKADEKSVADYCEKCHTHQALKEVNATRARRGLPPFQYDEGLTIAAIRCAKYRGEHLIEGHYRDFTFLPAGSTASAAGCGAATDHWGWLTCCTYERYRFAGAAWYRGRDGQRYMHLFVRK